MPEYSDNNGDGRRDHHRGSRQHREDEGRRREDSDDRSSSPQTQDGQTPNMNQLAQAMNKVLEEVQAVKQTSVAMRGELNTTQEAVLELKTKMDKPKVEEPKKTEETPKPVEASKPATQPPAQPKPFAAALGEGLKKLGEVSGKIVRGSIELLLSPVWAGVKIIEGFFGAISKSIFNSPKKTS